MGASFGTEGTYAFPNLFAGDFPRVEKKETIVSGAGNLVAGTVLGKITASSKLQTVNSGNVDGSENPYAVLAHDVDASAADAEAIVYHTGHFNETALTFGGADTADTHRAALRDLDIHLSKNVGA